MQKRTLVRAVVFFIVSATLVAAAANAVFAEEDLLNEIPLPEHGGGGDGIIQGIGGVGTLNYIPKFVSSTNLGNSILYELGGNVGIGTTSPSSVLDVRGIAQVTEQGAAPDTSGYAMFGVTRLPSTSNESYFGLTKQSTIPWGIGISDDNRFIVGLATPGRTIPSPAFSIDPYTSYTAIGGTLNLGGNLLVSNGTYLQEMRLQHGTDLPNYQGALQFAYNYDNALRLVTWANDTQVFGASADGGKVFFPSGNVGIGTTSPEQKLSVSGMISALPTSWSVPTVRGAFLYHSGESGNLYAYDYTSGHGDPIGITGSEINFGTYAANGMYDGTKLSILGSGNVGIGTTTPSQKLDVAGYVKGQSGLCIGNDCRTAWPSGGGGNITGGGSTNYLAKFTGSNSIGNGAIYDNGNIGIGTTSPSATLHVSGTSRIDSSTTGNAFYVLSNGTGSHAIRAKANSVDAGAAVYAETSSGNNSNAVFAKSNGTTIYGETWGDGFATGSDIGVHGLAASSTSTGGATLGVLGESRSIPDSGSDTSNGVFGWGRIGGAYGRTNGVWGETDSKGPPNGEPGPVSGVTGVAAKNVSGLQSMGVVGRTSRASSSSFGVYYQGGISGTGLISSIIRTNSGPRLIYATQSPEPWVEDYGEGKLKNGYVRINLDPVYLQTVAIDASHPFHVFVTPTGTSSLNGLRVIKNATGFRVQELNGGRSNGTFDWRIVAKRKGFENRRLDISEGAYSDPTLYPERFPDAKLTHEEFQTPQPQD